VTGRSAGSSSPTAGSRPRRIQHAGLVHAPRPDRRAWPGVLTGGGTPAGLRVIPAATWACDAGAVQRGESTPDALAFIGCQRVVTARRANRATFAHSQGLVLLTHPGPVGSRGGGEEQFGVAETAGTLIGPAVVRPVGGHRVTGAPGVPGRGSPAWASRLSRKTTGGLGWRNRSTAPPRWRRCAARYSGATPAQSQNVTAAIVTSKSRVGSWVSRPSVADSSAAA